MSGSAPVLHVGSPPDAAWATLPDGTRLVDSVRDLPDAPISWTAVLVRLDEESTDTGNDGSTTEDATALGESGTVDFDRIRSVAPDVPVIAYTEADDVDAGIDASRAGAEYVSGRRLAADGDTLADRVASAVEEELGVADDGFLEEFVRITNDGSAEFAEKLDALLELGRDHLDLRIGYASRVSDGRFGLLQQQGADELVAELAEAGMLDADGTVPLETTYCRRTVRGDDPGERGDEADGDSEGVAGDGGVQSYTNAGDEGWEGDPAYELFGLETYIGGRVVADGEVVGTLCFADEDRRDRPFTDAERLFVELLAEWLGGALERRQAREERAETTRRLENTLERISDGFFALDDDWRFTYVNERAAGLLDRDSAELVGRKVWDEFPDALGRKYERNYRRAMQRQEAVTFEDYYEPLDLWTEVNAYPSAEGLSVFFTDVTERKRREETLRDLLRTSERLQTVDDVERIADRLVHAASETLGHDINGVRLYDSGRDVLELVAMSDGLRERFGDREPRPPGDGVVGRAFTTGEHQVCADLWSLDDDREYMDVRSVVAVPLGTHGVFTVASTEPDAFDDADVSVVQLLATNATAAMDRVDRQQRLYTYERALENVDDMVCVLDETGYVTYMTRPLARWLGAKRVELVGQNLSAVIPEGTDAIDAALDAIHGDAAVDGSPSGVRVDGDTATLQIRVPRVDGGTRRGELRLSALSGRATGTVGSVTDMTELLQARTERDRERDRFTRLFEELPDPVMEVSLEADGTVIRTVNDAFAERFGYDSTAIRGQPITELDIADDRPMGAGSDDRALDERVREEGRVTTAVRRLTDEGPREFLFRGFSYETADGSHAFGIYTDITEQKHRERYLQVVNRILRHNLRNELNVVFGFASEISRLADDDQIAGYADRIETTGKRLSELSEGAAEIKRIVEGGLASELEPTSVRPIAERVARKHAEEHPAAEIDVSVPAGTTVRADKRLESVLGHLVENAIVHADRSEPRVEIAVREDPHDEVVTLTVADDGPGIPAEIRAIVAGEEEITQLRHNSGIGLWIVAWVVDSYTGGVTFGPGLDGEGTTVRLRLPEADPIDAGETVEDGGADPNEGSGSDDELDPAGVDETG